MKAERGKKNVFNYIEKDCGSTCSFLLRMSFVFFCLQGSWQDTDPESVWPLGSFRLGSPLEFNGYIQDLISLWAIFTLIESVMLAEQPGFGWHAKSDCF